MVYNTITKVNLYRRFQEVITTRGHYNYLTFILIFLSLGLGLIILYRYGNNGNIFLILTGFILIGTAMAVVYLFLFREHIK